MQTRYFLNSAPKRASFPPINVSLPNFIRPQNFSTSNTGARNFTTSLNNTPGLNLHSTLPQPHSVLLHTPVTTTPSFTLIPACRSRMAMGTHNYSTFAPAAPPTTHPSQPFPPNQITNPSFATTTAPPPTIIESSQRQSLQQQISLPTTLPGLEIADANPGRQKLLQYSYVWLIFSMVFFSYQMSEGYLNSSRENAILKRELERTQEVLNQILETQKQQQHGQNQNLNQNQAPSLNPNNNILAPPHHIPNPTAIYHLSHLPHFNHEHYYPHHHQHHHQHHHPQHNQMANSQPPQLTAPLQQTRIQHQIHHPALNSTLNTSGPSTRPPQ